MPVPRWGAVLLALFVTFLWSTSYILNKWAFAEGIGPMTLAGFRYALAALTLGLVRLWLNRRQQTEVAAAAAPAELAPSRPRLPLWQFAALGLSGYLVAQGVQYLGQYYVTPTQASMVLSVGNTLQVLLIGFLWLRELPGRLQWAGIMLAIAGVGIYYYPWDLGAQNLAGILFILFSGTGYAVQLTANRSLLSRKAAEPLDLVLYPMLIGAVGMVALGLALEPWPVFTPKLAGLLLWLGPVNGALAFFLWTYSQRFLQAFESSVLNNTMLLQISAMDVLLLSRQIDLKGVIGLICAGVGILTVQLARRGK